MKKNSQAYLVLPQKENSAYIKRLHRFYSRLCQLSCTNQSCRFIHILLDDATQSDFPLATTHDSPAKPVVVLDATSIYELDQAVLQHFKTVGLDTRFLLRPLIRVLLSQEWKKALFDKTLALTARIVLAGYAPFSMLKKLLERLTFLFIAHCHFHKKEVDFEPRLCISSKRVVIDYARSSNTLHIQLEFNPDIDTPEVKAAIQTPTVGLLDLARPHVTQLRVLDELRDVLPDAQAALTAHQTNDLLTDKLFLGVKQITLPKVKPAISSDMRFVKFDIADKARRANVRVTYDYKLSVQPSCNWKCKFCYLDSPPSSAKNPNDVRMVLEGLDRTRGNALVFSGGEPLANRLLPQLIDVAKKTSGLTVVVETNASLVTKALANTLAESGLDAAFVSFHSADSELFSQMVGHCVNVLGLVERITLLHEASIQIDLNVVLTNQNLQTIESTVDFIAQRMPFVRSVTLSFVAPVGQALKNRVVPNLEEVVQQIFPVVRSADAFPFKLQIPSACGFPPCLMAHLVDTDKIETLFVIARDSVSLSVDLLSRGASQERLFSSNCDKCRYFSVCYGLWPTYLYFYPPPKLRPIP